METVLIWVLVAIHKIKTYHQIKYRSLNFGNISHLDISPPKLLLLSNKLANVIPELDLKNPFVSLFKILCSKFPLEALKGEFKPPLGAEKRSLAESPLLPLSLRLKKPLSPLEPEDPGPKSVLPVRMAMWASISLRAASTFSGRPVTSKTGSLSLDGVTM